MTIDIIYWQLLRAGDSPNELRETFGAKWRKPIVMRPDADGIEMAERIRLSVNLLGGYTLEQLKAFTANL